VRFLAAQKDLWEREALPIFLTARLRDTAPTVVRLTLASLATIQKFTPAPQRWHVDLAIKQGIDLKQLVNLTLHDEEDIRDQATGLVFRLAHMTAAQENEFRQTPDENTRYVQLQGLDFQRAGQPTGTFGCMVYVDVTPYTENVTRTESLLREPVWNPRLTPFPPLGTSQTAPSDKDLPETPARARSSVALSTPPVIFRQTSQGAIQVIMAGRDITLADVTTGGVPSAHAAQKPIMINATPLLRTALTSTEAQAESLAGNVDLMGLPEELKCDLKYHQLGAWSSELTLPKRAGPASQYRPLQVASVKIVLEPLSP
jgi:hypothetical protein